MANNGNTNLPTDSQNPPTNPITPSNPPTRLFQSLTDAEAAYRQQTDQNRSQLAQFNLLNNKIDALINSINRLVNAFAPAGQPPSPNVDSEQTEQTERPLRPADPETNSHREFMERDRSAPPSDCSRGSS